MNKIYALIFFLLVNGTLKSQFVQKITSLNNTGDNGLAPRNLTVFNGKLYFFGTNEKVYVNKLMYTDGTEAGVTVVKTIDSAKLYPSLGHLTVLNNTLIFFTRTQVWKSDGTTPGTSLLANISTNNSGTFHSPSSTTPLPVLNNKVYFGGDITNSNPIKDQLWETDGTPGGTTLVKTINPSGPANIANMFVDGGKIYFTATNGVDKRQLWVSDGTAAGTQQLKKINPTADAYPFGFTSYNAKVYFIANDGVSGYKIWVTDGTDPGTTKVSTVPINPGGFTKFNGKLFFSATDIGIFSQLWSTDGTAAGTQLVKGDYHTQNGTQGFQPFSMVVHNNKLYMSGFDSTHATQLWMSDGTTAGTVQVSQITKQGGLTPRYLTSFQNKIVMADYDGTNCIQVWASDGTSAGTTMPIPPIVQATYPLYPFEGFVPFNNSLYYTASYGYFADYQLCRYTLFPVGIEKQNILNVSVYPNPVKTDLQITTDKEVFSALILDINGKTVKEIKNLDNHSIPVNELLPGLYLLLTEGKNGQRFSNRFVKE